MALKRSPADLRIEDFEIHPITCRNGHLMNERTKTERDDAKSFRECRVCRALNNGRNKLYAKAYKIYLKTGKAPRVTEEDVVEYCTKNLEGSA